MKKESRKKPVRGGLSALYRKEYDTWLAMHGRCYNPSSPAYRNYGLRGICVSEDWNDFARFLKDMGEKPDGFDLDRRDNNAGYSKENCRWISRRANCNNTRANVRLSHNGEVKTVAEWAEATGLRSDTIRRRLLNGWSIEQALSTPPLVSQWASPIPRKIRRCDCPIEFNGQVKTVSSWARAYSRSPTLVHQRLQTGWTIEEALLTAPRHYQRRAA